MAVRYASKAFCLAVLVLALSAVEAPAAPSISSVSGIITQGSTITISGSGFGSKSPAAPVLWDTVDNQSAYSSLGDGDDIPVTSDYPWRTNSTYGDKVEYCTSRTMRGQETAHYHWYGKGYLGWPRAMDSHTSNDNHQFYAYYWWKPAWDPNDLDGTKFIRVWDDPDGTDTRISWTSHDMYSFSDEYGMNRQYAKWSGDGGQWNNMEIWVDSDAHVMKAWVNCDLEFARAGLEWTPGTGSTTPQCTMTWPISTST